MEAARAELIKQTGATEQKIREEYDIPRTLDGPPDAQGNPTKIFTTYRKMQEAIAAGQGAPGAAPIPGAMRSGLGPGAQQTQTGLAGVYVDKVKEVSAAADAARRGLSSTEILLNSPKINWGGPLAGPKQEFNRVMTSLFGVNTEEVKTYEQAAQLMGDTMRTALRASDPNPTDRQQQSLYATLPGPARSAAGFQAGLRYMAGMQDWQVWRNAQLNQHLRPDPGNPNKVTDPAAFFQNENMSGIPFIVARMLPEDRKAYFAKVRETDPAALTKLINQLERIGANQ
jgi:hypothetical protein